MKNPLKVFGIPIGVVVLAATGFLPAFLRQLGLQSMNVMTRTAQGQISPLLLTLIALFGGIAAGSVITPSKIFTPKGILIGAIYNVALLWSVQFYFALRPQPNWFEYAFPCFIAAVPALLLSVLFSALKKNKPATPAVEAPASQQTPAIETPTTPADSGTVPPETPGDSGGV